MPRKASTPPERTSWPALNTTLNGPLRMLQIFRSAIKSKIGAAVAIIILGLIALTFVAADVTGSGSGGLGGASSGTIAEVGSEDITAAQLNDQANEALRRVRQQNPGVTMNELIAQGGLDIVLNDMVDLNAMYAFGKKYGIVAGDRLIDSEIQRAGGLQPQAIPRDSLATRLVARQLLAPAQLGALLPSEMAWRYAQLMTEKRTGSVLVLPSLSFAPEKEPTAAELASYYKANTSSFIRPERRVIRYATFGADAIKDVPAPTEAEIASRYKTDIAQYSALERRAITQLVLPTQAAAQAVLKEVNGGTSLEASASQKGLAAAKLGPLSKQDLSAQSSSEVAQAVFAAPEGKFVTARSPLGWYVVRVEKIDVRAARTFDQVKGEITTALAADKRRAALTDYLAKIEEQFSNNANLPEVAAKLGLQVRNTPEITEDGAVYGQGGQTIDAALAPVLKTAFSMEESQPQVAQAQGGTAFVIFDVSAIAPSAPAPLNQITGDVKLAYALDKGAEAAKAQALKIQAAMRRGEKLDAIVANIGKKLPPIERVGMSRPQLAQVQQSGGQVPPPIRLMFAMAKGTVKVQEAPQKRGWFIVVLDSIEAGKLGRNDASVTTAQRELGRTAGDEYAEALRKTITKEVGVKRNEAAITLLRDQLSGKAGEE